MTTYRQGDVLLVPYPFTDQSGSKQRPAVVLSLVKPILSSFDVRLVRRRLGALSASDQARVRALFAQVLDLP